MSLGLCAELYCLVAEDPTFTQLILPTLERCGTIAAADNMDKAFSDVESHQTTQLIKEVAKLSASNAMKRVTGRGGDGGNN